ncbi:L,D-transpeptidase family protein [Novosphingobium sp. M1R2S20]|uniref:L,D-transpeptidase family protein n=1 Tax=Novosphingobium rhizovicinum TaxID=3228928 RepID=A0ABV3R6P0_9SPHN
MDPAGESGADGNQEVVQSQSAANGADAMASRDPRSGEPAQQQGAVREQRPVMHIQVVLDRLGFSPGVINGEVNEATRNALRAFQEANGLPVTGTADQATRARFARWSSIAPTRVVTIPTEFASGSFQPVPDAPAAKARMERLGYSSLQEKLAERFHTTPETLRMLNPGGEPARGGDQVPASPKPSEAKATSAGSESSNMTFRAGQQIRVPNVGHDAIDPSGIDDKDWLTTLRNLGVGTDQPKVERVVVSKSKGTLKAYDGAGKLVASYTATMGSEHDPLPLGEWQIKGIARNPTFQYDPELFWDVPDSDPKQTLPPGPNNPVGVVWIDLSKEHYGIHGTPAPQTIGQTESHGCVRLTNWDAARLAQMVRPGTVAVFEA